MTDKTLMVATDVATLALFDPGELAHTAGWPFSWFGDAFAFEPECAAGRLVAWSTGSDGSFKLRVTTGALTAREAAYASPEWEFPYTVHHGRVMVAGIDALEWALRTPPDVQGIDTYGEWVDMPPGNYAVTVHAIFWDEEPGSDEEGADTLANYTAVFRLLAEGEAPPPAPRCPPQLIAGEEADDTPSEGSIYAFRPVDADADFSRPLAAFACAAVAPAGKRYQVEGHEGVYTLFGRTMAVNDAPFPYEVISQSFAVAPEIVPGAIGQLCRYVGGRTEHAGRRTMHEFYSAGRVRIEEVLRPMPMPKRKGTGGLFGAGGLLGARNVPDMVDVRAAALDTEAPVFRADEVAAMRAQLIAALDGDTPVARAAGKAAEYFRRMLKSGCPHEDISSWLTEALDFDDAARLELMRLSPQERLPALVAMACGAE
ncbi:hypothetical protein [Hyphomonas sp.]|uniref:hypothetical protein n=1 Tax=Hyphomonas sp. TaxID=87 RepID=UPI00391C30FB